MEIIVDGKRGFNVQAESPSISDILTEIDTYLRAQGRAMQTVMADGENIPPEKMGEVFAGKNPGEIQSLEVNSEVLSALVEESLGELEDVLPELPKVCHELAEVFQSESPDEGYAIFEQLAEIWAAVKLRQQQVIKVLELEIGTLRIGDRPLEELQDELNKTLQDAAKALEAKDLISLADLLEYELAPRAEDEKRIVDLLKTYSER